MCSFLTKVDKVTAEFEIVSKEQRAGKAVVFKNLSHFGRGKAYWNFGDDTPIYTNPMPDIDHVFEKPGEYELSLRVEFGGRSDVVKKWIRIGEGQHE